MDFNYSNENKVISIEDLKAKAQPIVMIKGYEEGEFLPFHLKRIRMLDMIKSGKIPNTVLNQATTLFDSDNKSKSKDSEFSEKDLSQMSDLMDAVCGACMVNPKYEDVKEYLTDEQRTEIFEWTQQGVKALEFFRNNKGNTGLHIDINEIP